MFEVIQAGRCRRLMFVDRPAHPFSARGFRARAGAQGAGIQLAAQFFDGEIDLAPR